MKRKISYEQSLALGHGRDIARSNQRRRVAARQAEEKVAAERQAAREKEEQRLRELRGGFEVGDRVTGREIIFRYQKTGVIVETGPYPLHEGVPVQADDGNIWTLARNSVEAS